MSEVINTNVFAEGKKFIDFSGLQYFWNKTKGYVDAADNRLSGQITINANAIAAIQGELEALSGGAGSIQTQISNAITALDLPNTYEAKGAAATAEQNAKDYADGKFQVAGDYETAGAAATALADAKTYVDGKVDGKFDAVGSAAAAETAAKAYADDLVVDINTTIQDNERVTAEALTELDGRVANLEAIDHAKLAEDASAAAVATILDGAPEKFDTLKEVAQWIADSETASDAADLVTRVAALEGIDHDAYVAADTALETSLKTFVANNYDAKGAADTAETNAKAYADQKVADLGIADYAKTADVNTAIAGVEAGYVAADATLETALKAYADQAETDAVTAANAYADGLAGNYEVAGAAAQALADAKADADAKLASYTKTTEMNAAIEAAKNAAIADAATKLADYYTKTEVDNLLSTNSQADQVYAKTYTDALFNSMKFAANSDIDALF
jgi:hypothetical protein